MSEWKVVEKVNGGKKKWINNEKIQENNEETLLIDKWKKEQIELKKKLITKDNFDFSIEEKTLKLIGGVDISFDPVNPKDAVASLVVLSFPELKVVYEIYEKVKMKLPYKAGFLAFREVDFLLDLIFKTQKTNPQFMPQLIMVDGSGIHHPRGFGLASHLGVLSGIPTIGIAKKLLVIDGITNEKVEKMKNELKGGEFENLKGNSGKIHGAV
jgi:endonuclease V